MGFYVYDTDSEAKRIMDSNPAVCREISDKISPSALDTAGAINRKVLASIVFSDKDKLKILNSIVHHLVIDDIKCRAAEIACGERPEVRRRDIFFVESAITFTSGIYKHCKENWLVTAPEDVRISRITARDRCSREDAMRRMGSQKDEAELIDRLKMESSIKIYEIINDGAYFHPILTQINRLLISQ